MVEEGEVLLSIVIDVAGLLEQYGTEEVVENLTEFGVVLYVADVLLLDLILDLSEVGL